MTQTDKSKLLCEKLLPLLKEGKEVEIHPSGTSMFPLINPPSDSVVLRNIGETPLKPGIFCCTSGKAGFWCCTVSAASDRMAIILPEITRQR